MKERGIIMYCRKCGKEIEDDTTFCVYCGTKASGSEFYSTTSETLNAIKVAKNLRRKAKISKRIYLCLLAIFVITFPFIFIFDFHFIPITILILVTIASFIVFTIWIGCTSGIPESERTEKEEKFVYVTSFIMEFLDFIKS